MELAGKKGPGWTLPEEVGVRGGGQLAAGTGGYIKIGKKIDQIPLGWRFSQKLRKHIIKKTPQHAIFWQKKGQKWLFQKFQLRRWAQH